MKKSILLIGLILSIQILTFAQIPTDGLVGYWPFNGNTNDYSANQNHGVIYGDIVGISNRNNEAESAIYFDGSGDYIDFGSILANEIDDFTIALWIKTPNSKGRIISRRVTRDTHFEFHVNSTGRINYYDGGSATLQHEFVNDNLWHYVCLVVNNGVANLFVDNNKSLDLASNLSIIDGSTNTLCGSVGFFDSDSYFLGSMDELTIYDRALSDEEISILYNNNLTPGAVYNSLWQKETDGNDIFFNLGNVSIGTTNSQGYKFAVAGNIIAEEVKVALQSSWPDFVFEENYLLLNLNDLENYIRDNKHLPNIPSAGIVQKEGYSLSEMDSKLLQKIEELTLHLIEQNNLNIRQNEEIKLLKEKIDMIQSKSVN